MSQNVLTSSNLSHSHLNVQQSADQRSEKEIRHKPKLSFYYLTSFSNRIFKLGALTYIPFAWFPWCMEFTPSSLALLSNTATTISYAFECVPVVWELSAIPLGRIPCPELLSNSYCSIAQPWHLDSKYKLIPASLLLWRILLLIWMISYSTRHSRKCADQ